MEQLYWAGTGKYQEWVEEIGKIAPAPDYGNTNNEYMNIYLDIGALYARASGGGNTIKTDLADRIARLQEKYEFDIDQFISDKTYREDTTNAILETIMDKDFTYTATYSTMSY